MPQNTSLGAFPNQFFSPKIKRKHKSIVHMPQRWGSLVKQLVVNSMCEILDISLALKIMHLLLESNWRTTIVWYPIFYFMFHFPDDKLHLNCQNYGINKAFFFNIYFYYKNDSKAGGVNIYMTLENVFLHLGD